MITLFESSESNSRCPLYVFSASSAVTDRHAAVNIQHSTHANVWRVMTWRRRRRDVRDVTWRSDITGRLCVAADMVLLTLHLSEVVNFLAFNKRLKGAVTGVQLVSKLINWMLFCNKIWCADSLQNLGPWWHYFPTPNALVKPKSSKFNQRYELTYKPRGRFKIDLCRRETNKINQFLRVSLVSRLSQPECLVFTG